MKKTHLLLAGLLLPVLLSAQPVKFSIKGQISPKATIAYLTIKNPLGKSIAFKADVVNGKFAISGELPSPMPGFIIIKYDSLPNMPTFGGILPFVSPGSDVLFLMVDQEEIKLTSSGLLRDAKVEGSSLCTAYRAYLDKLAAVNAGRFDNSPYLPVLQDVIAGNEYPYVTLEAMETIFGTGRDWNPLAVLESFNKLPAEVRESPKGMDVSRRLARETTVNAGSVAPELEMPTPEGKMVKLSDYRGKYVILDFWYSGCIPCRREHPLYRKLYAQYKDKGLEIISVSSDTDKKRWLLAIERDKMVWVNICDLKKYGETAGDVYKVTHSPENFLVGPDGVVIAKGLFGDELERKIDEIFK